MAVGTADSCDKNQIDRALYDRPPHIRIFFYGSLLRGEEPKRDIIKKKKSSEIL